MNGGRSFRFSGSSVAIVGVDKIAKFRITISLAIIVRNDYICIVRTDY